MELGGVLGGPDRFLESRVPAWLPPPLAYLGGPGALDKLPAVTRRVARPGYAGAAAVLVFVPIVADLLFSDRWRVFGYLAADAWYYLKVGRSLAEHGVLAFDQTHPTNGYHPLW
jgi:hypothetical protein